MTSRVEARTRPGFAAVGDAALRSRPRAVPAAGAGATGPTPGTSAPALSQVVALGSLFLLGADVTLVQGVSTGTAAAVALVPVWWRATGLFVGARALFVLGALALVSGLWLSARSASDHTVDPTLLRVALLTLAGALAAIGLVLWTRTVLSMRTVALAVAAGLVVHMALNPPNPVNPWKHGVALLLAVTLLAFLRRERPRPVELVVVVALAGISAVNDSRSAMAILLLAGLLIAWQLRPTTLSRRASGVATLLLLACGSVCVYLAGNALILEGYLGEATRQRSLEQIETSGSVILGGRPEWGASAALFLHDPLGYGPGVHANSTDVLVAKTGMAALNYNPNNGYVERYMFGSEMKLHAVIPDLWITYGIPGLLLGLTVLGLLGWSLATAVARRAASGLVLYLGCLTAWNMLFGPIVSSIDDLALTMGVVLLARSPGAPVRGRP